jgi:FtsH-binding integral membrane protein
LREPCRGPRETFHTWLAALIVLVAVGAGLGLWLASTGAGLLVASVVAIVFIALIAYAFSKALRAYRKYRHCQMALEVKRARRRL